MRKNLIMRKKIVVGAILLVGLRLSSAGRAAAFHSEHISVKAEGRGPDVILIHGFACSSEVWSGLSREVGSGFRLHSVSILGFAGSMPAKSLPESYLKACRDEIVRYMEEENLKRPVLIGHSIGGLISLLISSQESAKVGKVIVVDALPFFSLTFNPQATVAQVLPQARAMEKQLVGLDDKQFEQQAKSSVSILTKSDEKK